MEASIRSLRQPVILDGNFWLGVLLGAQATACFVGLLVLINTLWP